MNWNFYNILRLFDYDDKTNLLLDGKWGLERETHRILTTGDIALTNHPSALGDKLKNPHITTDFGESQLEFITSPHYLIEEAYGELSEIHKKAEDVLENEILWSMSMPPRLPREEEIPISKFSNSIEGKTKEVYRKGLALRYGKKMQMISGIHYNFSFGKEFIQYLFENFGGNTDKRVFADKIYFAMARNFLKYRWILIYLFGASPNFDESYAPLSEGDFNYATSIRVSSLGYANSTKNKYKVTYNNLEGYIKDVKRLLATKSNFFSELGIYNLGEQVQLNDNILQSEGELYSYVRFKQVLQKGETHMEALSKKGVDYIEIRILDINPFEKVGISIGQLYFMQVFMLYCLFESPEEITDEILDLTDKNHEMAALYGKDCNLLMKDYNNQEITLQDWSKNIFRKLRYIAEAMDKKAKYKKYVDTINKEYEKIINPSKILSYKISDEMNKYGENFLEFGLRRAKLNTGIKKNK
ncbi:MAG: glutamate--cysteine ligase [Epulopiscium sp.]|nr:glutamate--cysteine ligase [Candidatus Epulonipiscium sp.]